MIKTTLYLPDDLQSQLKAASRRTGRPQAELVRVALEQYLGQIEAPMPRSIGSGADGALSGKDSEDWLRRHWTPR